MTHREPDHATPGHSSSPTSLGWRPGVTVFPDELYPAPQSWAEKAYPKLVHYNRVEEGGHFAAWEQPQILSQELRDTFRSLR
jgi:pimeloyl-ACP methyl ester carboxylesterase